MVAQLMHEARDPALDPDYYTEGWAAEGLKAAGVEAPTIGDVSAQEEMTE